MILHYVIESSLQVKQQNSPQGFTDTVYTNIDNSNSRREGK